MKTPWASHQSSVRSGEDKITADRRRGTCTTGWETQDGTEKGTSHRARPIRLPFRVLLFFFFDLVGAFGVVSGMLDTLLRLGFFHRALGFFGALGTGFGTLLALFFLQLLAAQQFDECGVGAIAFAPSGANNAQVSAFAVAETRSRWCRKACPPRRWSSGRRRPGGARKDRRACPA